ncbi:MAG TPA: rRNA maturation RNase YbeY [Acidobacteria bacterium]|nr:rRNA maturation RNase YbeY [Acidobacteriota bacterium]
MKEPESTLPDDCEIVLQNPNRYPEAQARLLRPWVERLIAETARRSASVGVRFASDRELKRANRTWRGKDKPTDVLSFPGEDGHLGDILISVPTARRQAKAAGHTVERELRILLLHGVLHCLGYDHETDQGQMARLEHKLRRRLLEGEDLG